MNTLKYWGYVVLQTFVKGMPILGGLLVALILGFALFYSDKAFPQDNPYGFFQFQNQSMCTQIDKAKLWASNNGFMPLFTAENKMPAGTIRVVVWIQKNNGVLVVTETFGSEMACLVSIGDGVRLVGPEEGVNVLSSKGGLDAKL